MQNSATVPAEPGLPVFIDETSRTVFVVCDVPQPERWQRAVTKDFGSMRVVFTAADDQALGARSTQTPDERILTEAELKDWIAGENARVSAPLVESLRSSTGVIPFIGAWLSGGFGYPLWQPFLEECAATEEERAAVTARVEAGQFPEAAQLLVDRDKTAFYDRVRAAFAPLPRLEVAPDTPLTRLPLLAPGPTITTNFDSVIEAVCANAGSPFDSDRLVLGRNDPSRVVQALQENRPTLIKLHGDAAHTDSLTFTAVEYELSYGKAGRAGPVEQLATVLYTNRPLLFMGCSLKTDNTLSSLTKVHQDNPFLRNYAILASSYRESTRTARMKTLEEAGIRTLWFRPGQFEEISTILDDLLYRTAVDALPSTPGRATVPPSPAVPEPLFPGDSPSDPTSSIDAAIEALIEGRLVFFLGAAVHPTRLRGNQFYLEIRARARIPPPTRQRADAAQYVADAIDRDRLSSMVDDIVRQHLSRASNVHLLLAGLPRALRQAGVTAPLVVLTTNWDAVLEPAFAAADEPFDLFVYNHDGPYAGKFLHRSPDGSEVVVRRPEAYMRVTLSGSVLIKMNGGVDAESRWPGRFAVTTRDFEQLSVRLPAVFPRVLWDLVRPRSFLFWGHGLAEPDVRALMRHLHKLRPAPSWAVQLPPNQSDTLYWRDVAGVEIVNADLGDYVQRFTAAVMARLATASSL